MGKFQWLSILVHIWNQIDNFEATLILKFVIDFEENCSFGQKMLLMKYFKDYTISFLF